MNPWYTFIVTGLAFTLDNIVALILDRSSNPVTLTAKQRRTTNIVRTASGLVIMGFAWLTIANGWSQSGLKITLTSVFEGMAFAFAVAGAFRLLSGSVTAVAFRILGFETSFGQEFHKCFLGAYMFCIGGLAIVWIDRDISPVLVPTLIFVITLLISVAVHYFSTHRTKSTQQLSTTTKP